MFLMGWPHRGHPINEFPQDDPVLRKFCMHRFVNRV